MNGKKLLKLVTIVGVLYLAIVVLTCRTRFFYSPDKKRVVTRMDYLPLMLPQRTYFTSGQYHGVFPPSKYFRPVYSGRDGGFVLLLHWTDSTCILYNPFNRVDSAGSMTDFETRQINTNSKEWTELRGDTLAGNNILLSEYTLRELFFTRISRKDHK